MLCALHYVTGKSGHPYRCEYNDEKGRCKLGALFRCCDHFCSKLAAKVEANAGNPGRGPYCNAAPARRSSQDACESTYWTGKDGVSRYNCVYDTTGPENKCRLALGESCVC